MPFETRLHGWTDRMPAAAAVAWWFIKRWEFEIELGMLQVIEEMQDVRLFRGC